ncbi:hypothetical protein D039_0481B, partial [Vibrio parahaemolyticus EKP-028]
LRKYKARLL